VRTDADSDSYGHAEASLPDKDADLGSANGYADSNQHRGSADVDADPANRYARSNGNHGPNVFAVTVSPYSYKRADHLHGDGTTYPATFDADARTAGYHLYRVTCTECRDAIAWSEFL
jgi:hypothetical protein